MNDLKRALGLEARPARLFSKNADGSVVCHLSHRNCRIPLGGAGFCRVRQNEGGELVTLNYGVGVEMTQETIETEAVFHDSPGAAILSLGNVGCMLNCDFCHNWKTSQMRHVEREQIRHYTPEQVVSAAVEKGIGILSWTYNDPVVWHEFVCDTSRLAKSRGLRTLYKSAFSIDPRAVEELHDVIDIFSISLKSMDPEFYRTVAKGRLEPVLEGIKHVHRFKDRHLELSNLVVTGRNDTLPEVEKVVDWVLSELGPDVPLHFVRFHPDYKYTSVERTSIAFLRQARLRALEMGLKHVYLGNVYEEGEGLDTPCASCGAALVSRFGLRTAIVGLDDESRCRRCRRPSSIRLAASAAVPAARAGISLVDGAVRAAFSWKGDINACHVVLRNRGSSEAEVRYSHAGGDHSRRIRLRPGETWRFIASKRAAAEFGVAVEHPASIEVRFLDVLDRAHFPTPA